MYILIVIFNTTKFALPKSTRDQMSSLESHVLHLGGVMQ